MMNMDEKELKKITEEGEGETVEFKENFDKDSIETAAAFANAKGGIILIGIADRGKIKGVTVGKETLNEWANQIAQSTEPRLIPEIATTNIDGKTVVAIMIKQFPLKPVSAKGRYFKRVGSSNRAMTPNEITEMHIQSIGTSWDATIAENKTVEDIDLKNVERYIKEANAAGRRKIEESAAEVLEKLELIKNGKAAWAAILVFGKEPQKPLLQSAVHCGRFKLDKTRIIDDLMIESDLIDEVGETMKFISRHISVRYEFEGTPRRKEIWEYPLEALREAVINAIVHRDYTASSNIQIEIYDDRIEIWNPGRLLPGVRIEDLYKKEHKSVIRNKLIAQLFYDFGYIEKYGSGTVKILNLCKEQGLPPPEFMEEFGGFSVVFRKDIYNEKYLRDIGLNERQIKAVLYVKEKGKITNKEYREMTGLSDEGVRIDINKLIERNILQEKGKGRNTFYIIKKVGD